MLTVLAAETGGGSAAGGVLSAVVPFLLIGVAFYFLLIRPQRNRASRMAGVQQSVGVGDEVVTHGGLLGRVAEATDAEIVLETTPGVQLRFLRGAVGTVRVSAAAPDDPGDLDVPPQEPRTD